MNIDPISLEAAVLFLFESHGESVRGNRLRADDWRDEAIRVLGQLLPASSFDKLFEIRGRALPRSALKASDIHSGWVELEHEDGRRAVCRAETDWSNPTNGWKRCSLVEFTPQLQPGGMPLSVTGSVKQISTPTKELGS